MRKLTTFLALFFVISIQAQTHTQSTLDGPLDEHLDINQIPSEIDSAEAPPTENNAFELLAVEDIAALSAKILINDDLKRNLYELMVHKHDELNQEGLTIVEINEISLKYNDILLSVLNDSQKSIVVPDTPLMYRLSH